MSRRRRSEGKTGRAVRQRDISIVENKVTLCFPPGIQDVSFGLALPAPCIGDLVIRIRGRGERLAGRAGDGLRRGEGFAGGGWLGWGGIVGGVELGEGK